MVFPGLSAIPLILNGGGSIPDASPFDISGSFESGVDGLTLIEGSNPSQSWARRTSGAARTGSWKIEGGGVDYSIYRDFDVSETRGLFIRASAWGRSTSGSLNFGFQVLLDEVVVATNASAVSTTYQQKTVGPVAAGNSQVRVRFICGSSVPEHIYFDDWRIWGDVT